MEIVQLRMNICKMLNSNNRTKTKLVMKVLRLEPNRSSVGLIEKSQQDDKRMIIHEVLLVLVLMTTLSQRTADSLITVPFMAKGL